MQITPQLVKDRLLSNLEAVLIQLFPNGKVLGHEFRVGSVDGEAGKSLAVELRGRDKGAWQDFTYAKGTPGQSGDILALWCAAKGQSFKEAFPAMKRAAGFSQAEAHREREKPTAPRENILPITAKVHAYLNGRGVSDDTLKRYRVRSHRRPINVRDRNSEVSEDFMMFAFIDADGDAVMIKSTGIDLFDGKKNIWTSRPYYTLWGWWLVDDNCRELVICEGEIDAMSLWQLRPTNEQGELVPVLSLPAGVSNMDWIENDWEHLQRFERFWLVFDMDDPHVKTGLRAGEEGARECSRRLGAARCRRVKVPGGFKDVNKLLTSGDDRYLDWHTSWIPGAYTFDPPTISSPSEYMADAQARLARQRVSKAENTFIWPKVPWQFRNGEATVISGYPGGGKSQWCYQTHAHEMFIGQKVFFCSFEIEPGAMIVEFAYCLLGHEPSDAELVEVGNWLEGRLYFYRVDHEVGIKLNELLADLDYAAQRFGVTRFLVDSLHFIARKEDYEGQDKVSIEFTKFAKSRDVHLGFVCHSVAKKGDDIIPGLTHVEGSGGIVKPIDNGITIWRNVKKAAAILKAEEDNDPQKREAAERMHDGVMSVWKHRETGKWPRVKLWFDETGRSFKLNRGDPTYAPLAPPKGQDPTEKELF